LLIIAAYAAQIQINHTPNPPERQGFFRRYSLIFCWIYADSPLFPPFLSPFSPTTFASQILQKRTPPFSDVPSIQLSIESATAVIPATVPTGIPTAVAVAAAAKQNDNQNDNPQTVVAAKTVIKAPHKEYLPDKIDSETRLSRFSTYLMPEMKICAQIKNNCSQN